MPERRSLSYASLDDIMPDVDRLILGYDKAGQWTLGQISNHLSTALALTVDGLPVRVPWLKRKLFGPLAKWHVFRTGTMPTGIKIPARQLVPPSEADDRAEVEALRAAVRVFLGETGPFVSHPLFGPLSVDEWRRFHCIHSAHHLSFLIPR